MKELAEEFLKSKVREFKTSMSYDVRLSGHEIADLLEEYASSKQSSEWISVEHKPKAGKRVLIAVEREITSVKNGKQIKVEVIRARWIPKHFEEDYDNYNGDSDYCEEKDTYYWPEAWYETNHYEEVNWKVDDKVIGWMPLPRTEQLKK